MVIKEYSYNTQRNLKLSRHFCVGEFASKSGNKLYSNKVKIAPALIDKLEQLFTALSKYNIKSIQVTSGYRTPEHSVDVGGGRADRHTAGQAADIVCYDTASRVIPAKYVCCAAEDTGFTGIGYISANATHVDVRETAKWWGDETKNNGASISYRGYKSFYDYFNMEGAECRYNGKDYSAVYDKEYYLGVHEDLQQRLGNNAGLLIRHFIEYGMKEGRQACEDFNVHAYKNRYEDLQKAFGNDLKAYYIHYIDYGKKEGRNAK